MSCAQSEFGIGKTWQVYTKITPEHVWDEFESQMGAMALRLHATFFTGLCGFFLVITQQHLYT